MENSVALLAHQVCLGLNLNQDKEELPLMLPDHIAS